MKKQVNLAAEGIVWLLGWMPTSFTKNIEVLTEKINDQFFVNSDDDDDEVEMTDTLARVKPASRTVRFGDANTR